MDANMIARLLSGGSSSPRSNSSRGGYYPRAPMTQGQAIAGGLSGLPAMLKQMFPDIFQSEDEKKAALLKKLLLDLQIKETGAKLNLNKPIEDKRAAELKRLLLDAQIQETKMKKELLPIKMKEGFQGNLNEWLLNSVKTGQVLPIPGVADTDSSEYQSLMDTAQQYVPQQRQRELSTMPKPEPKTYAPSKGKQRVFDEIINLHKAGNVSTNDLLRVLGAKASPSLAKRREASTGYLKARAAKITQGIKTEVIKAARLSMENKNLKEFGFKNLGEMATVASEMTKRVLEKDKHSLLKDKTKQELALNWMEFLQTVKDKDTKQKMVDKKLDLKFQKWIYDVDLKRRKLGLLKRAESRKGFESLNKSIQDERGLDIREQEVIRRREQGEHGLDIREQEVIRRREQGERGLDIREQETIRKKQGKIDSTSWDRAAVSALKSYLGITQMTTLINPERQEVFSRAQALLSKYRDLGMDINTAASRAAQEAKQRISGSSDSQSTTALEYLETLGVKLK